MQSKELYKYELRYCYQMVIPQMKAYGSVLVKFPRFIRLSIISHEVGDL